MSAGKRISQVALLSVALALAGPMTTAEAQGSQTKHDSDYDVLKKATLEGKLQAPDTEDGSGKSAYYSFKIAKAKDEYGRDLSNLRGQILRLSPKGKTEELLKRHKVGDLVVIRGTVNLDRKQLEIISFKEMESSNAGAKEERGSHSKE